MWWESSLNDIENGRPAREPVARMLQEAKANTKINFKLLQRLVNF